jgi:hypothetical protein
MVQGQILQSPFVVPNFHFMICRIAAMRRDPVGGISPVHSNHDPNLLKLIEFRAPEELRVNGDNNGA